MTNLERLFVALEDVVNDEDRGVSDFRSVRDLRLAVKDEIFPHWQED